MTHAHDHATESFLAEELDLDAEVLRGYWSAALELVRSAAADPVRRVLDLGAGTGVGTIALAQLFPAAEVIAVDVSADMLDRIRAKALALGLAERVHLVEADLDAGLPALEPIDVTWASMSMHHVADPDRVLAEVFGASRVGGVVAVAEFTEHLRFLPDDLGIGRPGLEARCHELVRHEQAHALPHLGAHWAPKLTAAGSQVVADRVFPIDVADDSPAVRRYAEVWLQQLHARLGDQLDADDAHTLARLVDRDDPASVVNSGTVHIRGERTVTVARRP
jgi:ubiquinone/menaquinone biosynthesis C-methylase UbiE